MSEQQFDQEEFLGPQDLAEQQHVEESASDGPSSTKIFVGTFGAMMLIGALVVFGESSVAELRRAVAPYVESAKALSDDVQESRLWNDPVIYYDPQTLEILDDDEVEIRKAYWEDVEYWRQQRGDDYWQYSEQ